jgi:hypothetical protein
MTNPYAAPEVTPELAQEERKRPKMWRSLLVAYGVHHGCAVLGLFAGLAFNPILWYVLLYPCAILSAFIAIPILDVYLVIDSFAGVGPNGPHDHPETGWIPAVLVITIALASVSYAVCRRRELLAYIGLTSFVAAAWFMFACAAMERWRHGL